MDMTFNSWVSNQGVGDAWVARYATITIEKRIILSPGQWTPPPIFGQRGYSPNYALEGFHRPNSDYYSNTRFGFCHQTQNFYIANSTETKSQSDLKE